MIVLAIIEAGILSNFSQEVMAITWGSQVVIGLFLGLAAMEVKNERLQNLMCWLGCYCYISVPFILMVLMSSSSPA